MSKGSLMLEDLSRRTSLAVLPSDVPREHLDTDPAPPAVELDVLPFGWFQIGYPEDFPVGRVVPLHYFDRPLIAWRDEDGRLCVADAFCPHLGAHLGYGGSVVGTSVRCPFHGWTFGADGQCTGVPYSDRRNRLARLRIYPVSEVNDVVCVWFHPHETPPLWAVPKVLDGPHEADEAYRHRCTIATTWQELGENGVDVAHLSALHGFDVESFEVNVEEPYYRRVTTIASIAGYSSMAGSVQGKITTDSYGPGMVVIRYDAVVSMTVLFSAVPIDRRSVDVRLVFAPQASANGRRRRGLERLFIQTLIAQLEEDAVIWEHKTRPLRSALLPADWPIVQWRRWARTFNAPRFADS